MKSIVKIIFIIFITINFAYAEEMLTTDKIHPGMKGYGFTVFKGWEPERFEVEIIDVMKNIFPQNDMILARVKGNILEKSGVIAGMSGSPVYISNKLIGAVAYTWQFTKEPICGITPINMMLNEKQNSDEDYFDSEGKMKRITMPIAMHGFSVEAQKYLKPILEKKGFSFAAGTSAANLNKSDGKKLKGGDAVAINLIDGDLSIAAIGTVSYIKGNDVYIFGHPMGLAGNIALPISKAYIYTVVPTSALSFKMGAGSTPIGTTVFDGKAAVYCKLGKKANMIPVQINLTTWKNKAKYNFRVAGDKDYFISLLVSALMSSFTSRAGYMDDKTITMNFKIIVKHLGKKYAIHNKFLYSYIPSYYDLYAMINDLAAYFGIIQWNSFTEISIENVTIDVNVKKGIDYYIVEKAVADKDFYMPGDTVNVKIILKKYLGDYVTKRIKLQIPKNIKKGKYSIYVGSEPSVNSRLRGRYYDYFQIDSFEKLLEIGNKVENRKRLTAMFVYSDAGVKVKNKRMPSLPDNYLSILNIKSSTGKPYLFPKTRSKTINIDSPVYGIPEIKINIKTKITEGKKKNEGLRSSY